MSSKPEVRIPGKRFVTLDLDPKEILARPAASKIIASVFESAFNFAIDEMAIDMEYSERNGRLLIPRIVADDKLNDFVLSETGSSKPRSQRLSQIIYPVRLSIQLPGQLDTLIYEKDLDSSGPLADGHVEIDVRASGVTSHDVGVAEGQIIDDRLGSGISRIVNRVGPGVTQLKHGDRVCAWTSGGFGNISRTPAELVQFIPDKLSFETTASLPLAYCAACYSLLDAARLQSSERVLIS